MGNRYCNDDYRNDDGNGSNGNLHLFAFPVVFVLQFFGTIFEVPEYIFFSVSAILELGKHVNNKSFLII